jgi:hypothetical protein
MGAHRCRLAEVTEGCAANLSGKLRTPAISFIHVQEASIRPGLLARHAGASPGDGKAAKAKLRTVEYDATHCVEREFVEIEQLLASK